MYARILAAGALLLAMLTQVSHADVKEIIKNSEKKSGLFNLYWNADKGDLYLQIEAFNQPFLYQTSLVQGLGSNDIGLDRGKLADTQLVQFERQGNKVFLKALNTRYRANTEDLLEKRSVEEAFADSVLWGATLVQSDAKTHLIKLNSLLLSDRQYIKSALKNTNQGTYTLDKSRSAVAAEFSKSFPENTELSAWLTFTGNKPGRYVNQVTPDGKALTLLTRHSFIQLPDDGYQPRVFHPYSGYWADGYQDYAAPIQASMNVRFINRHRLAKKNPEADISEAKQPIIYYLDPGTPEPVRSALLDGARWWDQAFQAAGYSNAFQVKMLPADADPMDVRYNVIQWVHRATRGWSYGSSVVDPRTGEIIKGHVTLGSLRVRQDLLIARGLVPPFSKSDSGDEAQQAMALARIRQLSAHEVGHTLGIAHNFAASVNSRASVMDYPHPLVKLNKNQIDLSDAYGVGIGKWDIQAIKYGYSDFSTVNEQDALNSVVKESKDMGLLFLSDPDSRAMSSANPWSNLWDNGKDPVAELRRIGKIRAKALQNYSDAVLMSDQPLSDSQETLVPIYLLHRFQVQAAAKVIGGYDYGYWLKRDNQRPKMLESRWQRQALEALIETLSPEFLVLDDKLVSLLVPKAYGSYRNRESFPSNNGLVADPLAIAEASARHSLNWMLNASRLNRVYAFSSANNGFTIATVLDALFKRTLNDNFKDAQLRALHQRVNFVVADQLLSLVHSDTLNSQIKADLATRLQQWAENKSAKGDYKSHYQYLTRQVLKGLKDSKVKLIGKPAKMPPGSPI